MLLPLSCSGSEIHGAFDRTENLSTKDETL